MALQAKLAELSTNVVKLDEAVQVTAEQASCIRELGGYHAALSVEFDASLSSTHLAHETDT